MKWINPTIEYYIAKLHELIILTLETSDLIGHPLNEVDRPN